MRDPKHEIDFGEQIQGSRPLGLPVWMAWRWQRSSVPCRSDVVRRHRTANSSKGSRNVLLQVAGSASADTGDVAHAFGWFRLLHHRAARPLQQLLTVSVEFTWLIWRCSARAGAAIPL